MKYIFCTNKLAGLISVKPTLIPSNDNSESWNAHLFSIAGRKCILFTEKETCYSLLLVDVLKKDLKDIISLFYNAFISQLNTDKIEFTSNLSYVDKINYELTLFSTDNDRKTIGVMNSLILDLKSYCDTKFNKIEAARYFGQNIINGIPIGSRKFANAKKMMQAKINKIGE